MAEEHGADVSPPEVEEGESRKARLLFIFVNRRRFDEDDGVKSTMTGREVAALVRVPGEEAIVRRVQGREQIAVGVDESVQVQRAEHFFVTRRIVEGG